MAAAGQGDLRLVLGLGNPGRRYAGSRHNLGFAVVDELARRHGLNFRRRSLLSRWGKGRVGHRPVIVAKPRTYMNQSGQAAGALLNYFKLGPQDLLVVHDDLDLPLGRLKVALSGGAGGHKGVASLIQHLSSGKFVRLKLGLGRPRYQEEIEDYVLGGFYADQGEKVEETIMAATDCLQVVLEKGPEAAMRKFHRRAKEEEG